VPWQCLGWGGTPSFRATREANVIGGHSRKDELLTQLLHRSITEMNCDFGCSSGETPLNYDPKGWRRDALLQPELREAFF
jgi:hypothetical protein